MAKDKRKICPLTYSSGKGAYDQEVADFDYCVEESCAWWNVDFKECVLCRIARELTNLVPPKLVGGAR